MKALHRSSSKQRFVDYLRKRKERTAASSKGETQKPQRSFWRLFVEFWGLLQGCHGILIAALAMLSLATIVKLGPPAATKFAVDYVLLGQPLPADWQPYLPSDPRSLLVVLTAASVGVSFFGTFIHLAARWQATLASKRAQLRLRRKAYNHAARLPLHRVFQLKSGGVASLLREDAGGVGELVFSMLFNPWRALVQFLGGLAVLLWIDYRLLLGSFAVLPLVFWTHRTWIARIRPLYRDIRQRRQDLDARTTESFGGMRVVRAFGRQRSEATGFALDHHLMARQELHVWWAARLVEVLWDLLIPFASGLLLLYGGWRVLDGDLSLGDLMMFLVYLAMLLEPIAVIATSATQFQNNLSGLDRVLDILAEPREMADRLGTIAIHKPDVVGDIEITDVTFRYPGTDEPVLHDVSLSVRAGETIALVGASGAGKTTLCNLIARFYDPTAGSIRLDGVDLRDIQVESYRQILGIVEQDVFLFDGTIAENIGYASRDATLSQIEAAARSANAHEFIERLPDGYDTLIGERGVKLSGGQRQRLAIARAILADPKLFILDEATSNLDSRSERLIQESLELLLKDRTSFVIAHRLSTVQRADRIVVLDHGRIVEMGTHADLMANDGHYQHMVKLQHLAAAG